MDALLPTQEEVLIGSTQFVVGKVHLRDEPLIQDHRDEQCLLQQQLRHSVRAIREHGDELSRL
jgi:hypothetical protein